jgi:hypothetical protein
MRRTRIVDADGKATGERGRDAAGGSRAVSDGRDIGPCAVEGRGVTIAEPDVG